MARTLLRHAERHVPVSLTLDKGCKLLLHKCLPYSKFIVIGQIVYQSDFTVHCFSRSPLPAPCSLLPAPCFSPRLEYHGARHYPIFKERIIVE